MTCIFFSGCPDVEITGLLLLTSRAVNFHEGICDWGWIRAVRRLGGLGEAEEGAGHD